MRRRPLLLTGLAFFLWIGTSLIIPALVDAAVLPLISVRVTAWWVVLWLALGAVLTIAILYAALRRLEKPAVAAELEALTAQLAEAVLVCTPRGEVLWRNEKAEPLLGDADRLPEPLQALLPVHQPDDRRVAIHTVTVPGGARYAVQIVPLPEGTQALIARPMTTGEKESAFYERFIRRIVHDMRNPLAAIIAHAANLHDAVEVEADAWRRSAATIENEAQRLARLVDTMLFDARLEMVPLQIEQCDLVDVLEEAVYLHDEQALRAGKSLEIDAPSQPLSLEGDRDLLMRAFGNLIDNGLKYSEEGGQVRIQVENREDDYRILFVDSGQGIPPEYLPDRIFEPLVRARGHGSGSGLGLSIVKKIVEMHRGRIRAASTPGEGTTMTVILPKAEEAAP